MKLDKTIHTEATGSEERMAISLEERLRAATPAREAQERIAAMQDQVEAVEAGRQDRSLVQKLLGVLWSWVERLSPTYLTAQLREVLKALWQRLAALPLVRSFV